MTAVTRLPQPADTPRQRSPRTTDVARPAVASLQQQGTYSPREPGRALGRAEQPSCSGPERVLQAARPRADIRGTFSSWLGQRRGSRRHAGNDQAGKAKRQAGQTSDHLGQCRADLDSRSSARPARATYLPRPALAAAICASWTIALVAGVVLAMEIL